jgi:uncharacterized protein YjcR
MRQRPAKKEEPFGGPDDVGAILARNDAVGFPVSENLDPRRFAKFLYWSFWRLCDIAEFIGESENTLASWKRRDAWDVSSPLERAEGVVEARFITLVWKGLKDGRDFKEIDLLGRQMVTIARVRKFEGEGGHTGHLNDKVGNRNKGEKAKPRRNVITEEQLEILRQRHLDEMFGYQREWHAVRHLRHRMILKSRQIGATFYFAREALIHAMETGNNQIFLSASKRQAHVFRKYIVDFARLTIGVELTGEEMMLDRGDDPETGLPLPRPTLYFLGTNSRTAQSNNGDLYFDEFFWVHGFKTLEDVASGMASHKQFRLTYFSTPSSITDEAYPFWTGKAWNADRPKAERADFDTTHKALKDGRLCEDGIWRQIVTIEDAAAKGCTLFDLVGLRLRKSAAAWANLYMCQFVDDSLSVFPMAALKPCQIEHDAWPDINWTAQLTGYGRPYEGEVWLSYDPNGDGENADNAGLVLVAPPATPGVGKFRIIYKHQFRGSDFTDQALRILELFDRYNVTKIDIDETGLGKAVLQLVKQKKPWARGHRYDPLTKTRMVHKALDVISKKRLEYLIDWLDLTSALMSIRRTLTGSGRHLTYEAPRTRQSGHGDLAWALFQALDNEPLEAAIGVTHQSRVRIFN